MSQQQLTEVREALNTDLFLFAWTIFGYQDMNADLHGQLCSLLEAWGEPDYRRLLIQIPRGHLKSSLCTIANSLWQVCKDPDAPVAIFNEREDNTKKWLKTIREVVERSRIFQEVYRDILPPGIHPEDEAKGITRPKTWKWSDTKLDFERSRHNIPEASITGLGIGAAAAGGHWPKIIKDDLISEDAKLSNSVMQRSKDWLDNSFALEEPALSGQDLIICTPWRYDDVYAHALQKYDYQLYRRRAIEDGKVIFPEKFNAERLEKIRKADPFHYASQFQCTPRPGRDQAFDEDWVRYSTVQGSAVVIEKESFDPTLSMVETELPPAQRIPLHQMEKALLIDPAPSEDSEVKRNANARNALVVVGHDYWGRKHVLDVWADRVSPPEVLSKIFELCDQWGIETIAIEEVVFSVLYRHWINERARKENRWVRVVGLKPSNRTKNARINALIGPIQGGHFYVSRSCAKAVCQELSEYPYGTTRDILDALSYYDAPGVLPRPLSPEELDQLRERGENWTNQYEGIDPRTGY
jgi:hypothetical protein